MVTGAVDGGTLALSGGGEVRLAGLAALAPSPAAERARSQLAALVAGGPVTLVKVGEGPDRYGREVAYVFAGDRLVQAELVAAGLGLPQWLPGEDACLGQLVAAEGPARRAHTGLWSESAYRPLAANDPALQDRVGLYAIVGGRVASVRDGDSLTFVNFGVDRRRSLTAFVTPAVAGQLAGEGRPLAALVGKTVEVRGMIEEIGGPAIRLRHPAELAVVSDNE